MGPSVSAGPAQASTSTSGFQGLIGAFESFSFVDAALQDPDRTSTSLVNAAIRLRATMINDAGVVKTITTMAGERKTMMDKLLAKIMREADRLDADEPEEVELNQSAMEGVELGEPEAGPSGNASGSLEEKETEEPEQEAE